MSRQLSALADRALDSVRDGARLGLGTGHTIEAFLERLGERVRGGLRVRGVPTSEVTTQKARELGIPLDTLDAPEPLDMTVDGADEVERGTLNLIKGWGGALVRERIVAAASRQQIILVTSEKIVDCLGARGKLPVEVIPLAAPYCRRRMLKKDERGTMNDESKGLPHSDFGIDPRISILDVQLRGEPGKPFVTDNGNWILDCSIEPLQNSANLDRWLCSIPGVVDTGFFFGTASVVLVAEGDAIQELHR
jgi:ribose 5-phosphate isomerase A